MATVSAGARLHVGFCNLSLAHERLYGGIGVALAEPRVEITAEPVDAGSVAAGDAAADHAGSDDAAAGPDADHAVTATAADSGDPDALVAEYAALAADLLDVPGAKVTVEDRLPRHVGLGSGTQLALATYAAIARAYDEPVDVRAAAPQLGRGGRSGVGVASFQRGGFVVDGGHPTARFTTERPERGEWTVPPIVARHELPDDWRFVLAIPEVGGEDVATTDAEATDGNANRGRSGEDEDAAMRTVVEQATPSVADEVAAVVVRRLLPAAAEGDRGAFASAIAEIERLNGSWYADAQGGVFRPPAGAIVEALQGDDAVDSAGQSSWGPTVYGLTTEARADAARAAATEALDVAGCAGTVRVVSPANEGARF